MKQWIKSFIVVALFIIVAWGILALLALYGSKDFVFISLLFFVSLGLEKIYDDFIK